MNLTPYERTARHVVRRECRKPGLLVWDADGGQSWRFTGHDEYGAERWVRDDDLIAYYRDGGLDDNAAQLWTTGTVRDEIALSRTMRIGIPVWGDTLTHDLICALLEREGLEVYGCFVRGKGKWQKSYPITFAIDTMCRATPFAAIFAALQLVYPNELPKRASKVIVGDKDED